MKRQTRFIVGVALVLGVAIAGPARAQNPLSFFTDVFKNIQELNVTYSFPRLNSPSAIARTPLHGLGLEASFDIAVGQSDSKNPRPPLEPPCPPRDPVATSKEGPRDTVPRLTISSCTVLTHRGDSTITAAFGVKQVAKDSTKDPDTGFDVEIALSYSQIQGLQSDTSAQPVPLFGTLEEFPVVAAYLDFPAIRKGKSILSIQPYVGLRAGLVRLNSLRAYVQDSVAVTGAASSFAIGAEAGFSVCLDHMCGFAEYGRTRRSFDVVEWTPDPSKRFVPAVLPRTLSFSTEELGIGLQVKIH